MADTHFNASHPLAIHRNNPQLGHGREWLDLKALTQYASVSERTIREWVHRAADPLPAVRVGAILVRRAEFDRWLESHRLDPINLGCIVEEMVSDLVGRN